jgi:hypothetical protein
MLFVLKKVLSRKIHQGILPFSIEEVDQSDYIEELILNGTLCLWALYKESNMSKHIRSFSNYGGIAHIEIKRKTDLEKNNIFILFPSFE